MSEITDGPMVPDAAYVELAAAYCEANLLAALRDAGLGPGDIVFVHVCLDTLGRAPAAAAKTGPSARGAMLLRVLREAVGDTGTLLFPAYTFSFCRQERFDLDRSPTCGGDWSSSADVLEYARLAPGAVRSHDPIHSVVGIGQAAAPLLKDLPPTCFGENSLHHRLRLAGSKICLIGVGVHEASMVLHAEVMSKAPFRYKKMFTGEIVEQGNARRAGWIYDVRVRCPNTELEPERIAREASRRGVMRSVSIGRDALHVVDAQQFYDFLRDEIAADPWFTVTGPPVADLTALERTRVAPAGAVGGERGPAVTLPPDAPMEEIVRSLWMMKRDIVSDGYDAALSALASQVPMTIHEYPAGTECFTWIVPEKWTCQEAWLETLDGRRLISYDDHPLHVVSYSLPFDGIVTRDELMRHLHVHPLLPGATPFIFKYYERDWGLCCSQRLRDSLRDPHYRVRIRTSFSYGTLKVGEIVVPGRTDDTIVLAAHLCHPGMANDDLSGVAVAIGVIRELLRESQEARKAGDVRDGKPPRRYTYRLLILPETIGSLAYLSDHQALVPRMKGGLFLEMLGLENPHALQLSFAGDTDVDACFVSALRRHDASGWTGPYRTLLGNDERQFNAPGVRVPMLSLMRVLSPDAPDYPYREYHSSDDTPAIVSPARLAESRDLVLHMIDELERSRVPINRFAGELCCSRYGVHIDWYSDPDGHKAMFAVLDLVDGTRSIAQIAQATGQSADVVTRVLDRLEERGLIDYGDAIDHAAVIESVSSIGIIGGEAAS